MFGYVTLYRKGLADAEMDRYQAYYCGLCRTLGRRYGRTGQLALSYDMAFVAILLTALYDTPTAFSEGRCVPHPLKKRPRADNELLDYAADMTAALAYYNFLDDWQDDHRRASLAQAQKLEPSLPALRERWPRQLQTMAAHARETCRAAGRETNDAVLLAAMEEVGLDNPRALLKRYPFEMSGGMLQRMMVALALLSRAPFIIADEPTTDLDAIAQARILDLLADIVARRGLGLLLVTHDMGVVARLAHHVTVMENGRLVEHCDVNTLFSAPRHPLSQRLLAAHLALYGLEKTP